jgi:hypothetical protein
LSTGKDRDIYSVGTECQVSANVNEAVDCKALLGGIYRSS